MSSEQSSGPLFKTQDLRTEKSIVALLDTTRHEDLIDSVDEALRLIGFDFNRKFGRVAIKPNLCYYYGPTVGETTDPRFVGALIDLLRDHGAVEEISLVESDATAMRMKHAVTVLGFDRLAREKNVKLVNLSKDVQCESSDPDLISRQIKIPKTLADADLFITVPKLKLHGLFGLTCALKNQFGCIPARRKIAFHEDIHRVIAHVNRALTPDLVLVDGLVCLGRTPRRLNLIMASHDPVAVDFVAAKIAGLATRTVRYIAESEKLGVGSTSVKLVGDDLRPFAEMFPRKRFVHGVTTNFFMRAYSTYLRLFTLEGRIPRPALGMPY